MTMRSHLPARWTAALALTLAVAVTYDPIVFPSLGVLALPLGVYVAATTTGWPRDNAVAIAAASGLVVFVGLLSVWRVTSVSVVAFDVVTVVALRPEGRRALGYRLLTLLVWLLVAIDVGAWWPLLLVPAIVAGTDELARLTASDVPELSRGSGASGRLEPAVAGSGPITRVTSAEDDAPARREASMALALASLACVLLVTLDAADSIPPVLVTVASALAGIVLAIRSLRTDPMRATVALVLAAIPLLAIGYFVLFVLSGGFDDFSFM